MKKRLILSNIVLPLLKQIIMAENLMDGLFTEMNRVHEIIKEYEDPMLKGAGSFAAAFMKVDIQNAERAIRESDVIKMLQAYSKLKEYEL